MFPRPVVHAVGQIAERVVDAQELSSAIKDNDIPSTTLFNFGDVKL
jgi:hypothetical protein